MRVAHFGTFDVPNYGDLLFPLILERQLSSIVDEFVHVSPVGGQPYADVPASIPYRQAKQLKYDAVVVGGGNILHARSTSLPAYHSVRHRAYPGLWGGAAELAAQQRIPLVFNTPGAPVDFSRTGSPLLTATLKCASYVAVRDAYSAERIWSASSSHPEVVPDSALSLAQILPAPPEDVSRIQGLREYNGEGSSLESGRYIAVHINDRYGTNDGVSLARTLDELAASTGLTICLLGIGKCHGDDQFIASVAGSMESATFAIPDPTRVQDVAALIARSAFYVGSSLHGFITASSYRVPGYLVASHGAQSKFLGLLEQLHDPARMVSDWSAVPSSLGSAFNTGSMTIPPGMAEVDGRLGDHWDAMRASVVSGRPAGGPSGVTIRSLQQLNVLHNLAGEKQRSLRSRLFRRSEAR